MILRCRSLFGCILIIMSGWLTPDASAQLDGRSVRTLHGGQIVQLHWDAAPIPDDPSTYPRIPSFGAERFPSSVPTEALARRIASLGWDGLLCLEINWFETPDQIRSKTDEYRQFIDSMKRKGMHDNFISCMFTYRNGYREPASPEFGPKLPQWYEDELWEKLLAYFSALGRIAKESGAVGVTFDVEEYEQGLFHPNMYPDHPHIKEIVRQRGYQLSKAMLDQFPDMWLMILPNHYLWGFPEKDMPELMVPMAEGILTAFAEVQKDQPQGGVVFCSEFTYGPPSFFGQQMTLEGCRVAVNREYTGMRDALAAWGEKNPDYFENRVQLGAGIWPIGDYLGDEGGVNNYRYTAEQFGHMVNAAKERCPRWLWIYTQDDAWIYQDFDDYNRVMQGIHARPQYLLGEVMSGDDSAAGAYVPLPGGADRSAKAGLKTYALFTEKSLPDDTARKYVLSAEFNGQPIAAFGGETELKPSESAIADDFSVGTLHNSWVRRAFHGDSSANGSSDDTGILVKPSNGQLEVVGMSRADGIGSAIRLDDWKFTDATVEVDLTRFESDGDPIGGTACVTLFADDTHWFRLERSYKRGHHYIPDEKRHSNGLYYTWQNGGPIETARGVHLTDGRVTPLKLIYRDGKLICLAGEVRVHEQEIDLAGGLSVELGGFAPKGVKLRASFDNLIIDGTRAQ